MYGGKFAFQNRLSWLVVGRKFTIFALFYSEGLSNGGFFALRFWGAYTWRGLFSEFYGSFGYEQEHDLLQMSGHANGVCYYLELQKIYCMLILWICTFSPPKL